MLKLLKHACVTRRLFNNKVLIENKHFSYNAKEPICFWKKKRCSMCNDFVEYVNRSDATDNESLRQYLVIEANNLQSIHKPICKEELKSLIHLYRCIGEQDRALYQTLFNVITQKYLDCEATEKVALMNLLMSSASSLDIQDFNALLQIYVENNLHFNVDNFLANLDTVQLEPDKDTMFLVFKYCCQRGLKEKALNIMPELLSCEKFSSEEIYADLMISHAKSGNIGKALNIFKVMEENDVEKEAKAHTALMCVYAMQNDGKSMKLVHDLCTMRSLKLSCDDAIKVLYTLVFHGFPNTVLRVFDYFRLTNANKNFLHFLLQLVDMGQEKLAIQLWLRILRNIPDTELKQNVYQYIFCKKVFKNTSDLENAHMMLMRNDNDHVLKFQMLQTLNMDDNLEKYKSYIKILIDEKEYQLQSLHFWPLFAKYMKEMDLYGIIQTIDYMVNVCKIQPCFDTLKNFVIPYIISHNYYINLLRVVNVSHELIDNAIIYVHFQYFRTRKPLQHMILNESVYRYDLLRSAFLYTLQKTEDINGCVEIALNFKYVNSCTNPNTHDVENIVSSVPMNDILLDFIQYFPKEKKLHTMLKRRMKEKNVFLPEKTLHTMDASPSRDSIHLPKPDQSSQNGENKKNGYMEQINSMIRRFTVNSDNFTPVRNIPEAFEQATKLFADFMEHNKYILEFLEKYSVCNSTTVEDALVECRKSYLQLETIFRPIIHSTNTEGTRHILHLQTFYWTARKYMDKRERQLTDRTVIALMCIFKRYGPAPMLDILKYISLQYHFIPDGIIDLLMALKKFRSDNVFQSVIDIYEEVDSVKCNTDLLFCHLKQNNYEAAIEHYMKCATNSEHLALRIQWARDKQDYNILQSLRNVVLPSSGNSQDYIISTIDEALSNEEQVHPTEQEQNWMARDVKTPRYFSSNMYEYMTDDQNCDIIRRRQINNKW